MKDKKVSFDDKVAKLIMEWEGKLPVCFSSKKFCAELKKLAKEGKDN